VLGNRFGASFLDWFLAKTGYDGQQAPEKTEPMWPSNLYEPVPGDHGSTGIFSDQAHSWSPQVWAIRNRGLAYGIGAALAGAVGAVGIAAVRRSR
jgi:hypothetical protein